MTRGDYYQAAIMLASISLLMSIANYFHFLWRRRLSIALTPCFVEDQGDGRRIIPLQMIKDRSERMRLGMGVLIENHSDRPWCVAHVWQEEATSMGFVRRDIQNEFVPSKFPNVVEANNAVLLLLPTSSRARQEARLRIVITFVGGKERVLAIPKTMVG